MTLPVRERLRQRLGRLAAPPADARPTVERRLIADGILHEKWRVPCPGGSIPCWFLVAETTPLPAPAVVALHPHGRQFELGKSLVAGLAGEPSRAYGLALARAGFAVLVPDMLGFEERRPPLAARKGNYALAGEAYERLLAMNALVSGETLQGAMLTDLSCCAGALATDERADLRNLALMGQSYGGQETLFGLLFDERYRIGVVSCGFSLVRLLVERSISHNLALYVPGLLPDLDFDALVPAIAPRPLFVIAGRADAIFPVDGVELVEAAARAAWTAAGAPPGALHFHYFDGPHDLPASALDAATRWLQQQATGGRRG